MAPDHPAPITQYRFKITFPISPCDPAACHDFAMHCNLFAGLKSRKPDKAAPVFVAKRQGKKKIAYRQDIQAGKLLRPDFPNPFKKPNRCLQTGLIRVRLLRHTTSLVDSPCVINEGRRVSDFRFHLLGGPPKPGPRRMSRKVVTSTSSSICCANRAASSSL